MRFFCADMEAVRVVPLDAPDLRPFTPILNNAQKGSAKLKGHPLTPEQLVARRELTRILVQWRYTDFSLPYWYGQYIELASDHHKRSLTITGLDIKEYEALFMAAIRHLMSIIRPGEKLVILAFQSPGSLIPGKKLGECVTLGYYDKLAVSRQVRGVNLVKQEGGIINVIDADAYMELFEEAEAVLEASAIAGSGVESTAASAPLKEAVVCSGADVGLRPPLSVPTSSGSSAAKAAPVSLSHAALWPRSSSSPRGSDEGAGVSLPPLGLISPA